jgi:hypothetical protein
VFIYLLTLQNTFHCPYYKNTSAIGERQWKSNPSIHNTLDTILSGDGVIINEVRCGNWTYWNSYRSLATSTYNCFLNSRILQITTAHTLLSRLSLHSSSGNGFQQRTFPILWVPDLSTASVTSLSQQQLLYRSSPVNHSCQSQSSITTDGQSASVLVTHHRPATNVSPSFFNYFRQLRICWCGAPSLTRSQVCSFQFLLDIANAAFLRSEFHGTHERMLLSLLFRLPLPGVPGFCIYFP